MRTDLTAGWIGAAIAATAVLGAVSPAGAAGSVISAMPPASCTEVLTVEASSCLTTRFWTCPGDLPGAQWYGVVIDGVEAEVTMLDPSGNPAKTHYIETEATVRMIDIVDPVDMAALVATGTDAFDYVRSRDDGGADERYVGEMSMTGRLSQIDGRDLPNVLIRYEVFRDGASIWSGSALQYLIPDRNVLVYGVDYDASGAPLSDFTPLRQLAPGQRAANPTCQG